MTIDVLPTVAELLGAPLPAHPIDGLSITQLMIGENQPSPHEALYFYWGNNLHAVRSGKWKLHFPHPYRTLNGQPGGQDGIPAPYQNATLEESLYDLEDDPAESRNLASQFPEVVDRLKSLASIARKELGDGSQKGTAIRP
jgi:arylsulfatase A